MIHYQSIYLIILVQHALPVIQKESMKMLFIIHHIMIRSFITLQINCNINLKKFPASEAVMSHWIRDSLLSLTFIFRYTPTI